MPDYIKNIYKYLLINKWSPDYAIQLGSTISGTFINGKSEALDFLWKYKRI